MYPVFHEEMCHTVLEDRQSGQREMQARGSFYKYFLNFLGSMVLNFLYVILCCGSGGVLRNRVQLTAWWSLIRKTLLWKYNVMMASEDRDRTRSIV